MVKIENFLLSIENINYTRLEDYEKSLFRKYGQEYMLRITPTEYKTALRLHNEVFKITQKVKRNQKSLKKRIKK